jgi:hypothetical protein
MMLGMSLPVFTAFHVVLSLIGIAAGIVVVLGFLASKQFAAITHLFLATTVITSVTGYLFPFTGFKPSYVVGALSLIALALAIVALYTFHLAGRWRATYVIASVIALYFNLFVLVVQSFLKVHALHELAPTGTEGPFKIAQVTLLILFIVIGTLSVRKFHPDQFRPL